MQTGSSEPLSGWKSGKKTYVALWNQTERALGESVAMDQGVVRMERKTGLKTDNF